MMGAFARSARAATGKFGSPAAIFGSSNLLVWDDAQTSGSMTLHNSGGTDFITAMTDRDGGPSLTSLSGSDNNPLRPTGMSGGTKPGVEMNFGGLQSASGQSTGGSAHYTGFAVMIAGSANGKVIAIKGDGEPNLFGVNSLILIQMNGTTDLFCYRGGNNLSYATVTPGGQYRVISVYDDTTHRMYINGSLVASSTTDPSARGNLPSTGSFCFGSNDSGPGTLNACMGDWGIAAVAATTQQVADMDAYLAGRW